MGKFFKGGTGHFRPQVRATNTNINNICNRLAGAANPTTVSNFITDALNSFELFFNLRRVQAQLEREASQRGDRLDRHQLHQLIATEVGVPLNDVEMMDGRLSGSDYSLNATQSSEDEGREWIDTIEDESAQTQHVIEDEHDTDQLRQWLLQALHALNDRERFIVRERKLQEEPRTLESLGKELGLSKERVRQLEAAAFSKMRKYLEKNSQEVVSFF